MNFKIREMQISDTPQVADISMRAWQTAYDLIIVSVKLYRFWIDITDTGTLIISDTGRNIHRLIDLVKKLDRKPTEEDKERFEKRRRHEKKLKELKAKSCSEDHKHS